MTSDLLKIGSRITVLPIIHGSGDCALEVRRWMLREPYDCLAVPLPGSFQEDVERAISQLPRPVIVAQPDRSRYGTTWSPDADADESDDDRRILSYVPIDPCQGVIAALRLAIEERMAREFIDLETCRFEPYSAVLPDAYALKKVSIERFAAVVLPSLQRIPAGQPRWRVSHMAQRLRQLERKYERILLVCSLLDWPWIREAYMDRVAAEAEDEIVQETDTYHVDPRHLVFLFGELPFITGLYERARRELEDDANLSVDGVKEMLLAARTTYQQEFRGRARKITPALLSQCLKYIRNLSLIEHRMTPDLYSIIVAAQQVFGDAYAIHLVERACDYPSGGDTDESMLQLGVDEARLPDGEMVEVVNRLPGPPLAWRRMQLHRRPPREDVRRWQTQWNPLNQCSWPPEDDRIEDFRTHVMDRARAVMGADLARSEKFTTSVMDGLDVRETLRHWYEGDIYVKVLPPSVGFLDTVVMLFDSPADPRDYPWRTTWYAEHRQESTLAFFATDYRQEMVGPGICLATYGGALFFYPPISVPDVWSDPRLDFTETLEERLLAAACLHSRSRHIALLSPLPPGAGWRRLARRFSRRWVHLPLGHFSDSTVQQLRLVHVLNGQQVRSYAAHFIRRA
jgi:hypothetical protein